MNNMPKSKSIDWLRELRKLERYCNKKGYAVIYKPVKLDAIYYQENRIVIGTNHSDEIALYCLLHEMGHAILFGREKTYEREFDHVYHNFSRQSMTYRLTIIQEELDAWKEGLKLANRLKIKVDRRKYEIYKTKCISTYLSWTKGRE